jgi:hypothetical protein
MTTCGKPPHHCVWRPGAFNATATRHRPRKLAAGTLLGAAAAAIIAATARMSGQSEPASH